MGREDMEALARDFGMTRDELAASLVKTLQDAGHLPENGQTFIPDDKGGMRPIELPDKRERES